MVQYVLKIAQKKYSPNSTYYLGVLQKASKTPILCHGNTLFDAFCVFALFFAENITKQPNVLFGLYIED